MLLNQFLFLAAVLFCTGVYGVLARRNAVMVLMVMAVLSFHQHIELHSTQVRPYHPRHPQFVAFNR